MERQTGSTPEELAEARANPCPEELRYLWDTFCEVSARRAWDEGRPAPLSNLELLAWLQLRGVRLTPFEVGVLDQLEAAYLSVPHNEVKQ